jgi:hypothetical protein
MPSFVRPWRPLPWLLVLLLAGCRSEQVAFVFAPGTGTFASLPRRASVPATQAAPYRHALSDSAEVFLAARQSTQPGPAHRRHLAGHARLLSPRRAMAGQRLTKGLAARPPLTLGPHPAERAFLVSGAGSTLLGLLLNYAASGATASRMLLLGSGHVLLVLGSLLLLAWFVLLLLRAKNE